MTGPTQPAVSNRKRWGDGAWIAGSLGAATRCAAQANIRFADREPIEQILERASSSHYGVRSLIHELVQSELFLNK